MTEDEVLAILRKEIKEIAKAAAIKEGSMNYAEGKGATSPKTLDAIVRAVEERERSKP